MVREGIINIHSFVKNIPPLFLFLLLPLPGVGCGWVYFCAWFGFHPHFVFGQGIKALMAVTLFASAGYLGVSCVAALTKRFGALHSAITTTARKALTLMLSFIVFPNKPFSVQHLIGAAVFVFGLVVSEKREYHKI